AAQGLSVPPVCPSTLVGLAHPWRNGGKKGEKGPARPAAEIANHWYRSLLRPRRERPRRSAAAQRDELAPPHSITSSAVARSVGGTSRPSAVAAFRLITT